MEAQENEMSTSSSEFDDDFINDVKFELQCALDEVQSSGNFMTCQKVDFFINPGLHVPSIGDIGLPISAEHAKAMVAFCHRSPYGKGTETLVDDNVRKSWQLDANQFSLRNPKWETQVGIFMANAITGLGLDANPLEVEAELYKLLIYEEGAFFLPHQDSEKADGMFGTLVVCLSSKHEGGEVIASHKDKSFKFDTAPASEFGASWAAWYADIKHEVKPVTSGYRIVLVYNLIHRPSAELLKYRDDSTARLVHILETWTRAATSVSYTEGWSGFHVEDETCPPALVYILEHQYSSVELRPSRLKGIDQRRFAQLQNACESKGFGVYLTNIEKQRTGGVADGDYYGRYTRYDDSGNHEIEEEYDSSLKLSHVVDAKGVMVARDLPFPEFMIVPEDIFDREPDDEDFTGFTGNEGASTTHFYRETGILIVPRDYQFLFELEIAKSGKGDVDSILRKCRQSFADQPTNFQARQRLVQVCRVLIPMKRYESNYSGKVSTSMTADEIFQIAFDLEDMDLFGRAMTMIASQPSPSQLAHIAKAIARHGLDALRSPLDSVLSLTNRMTYHNSRNFLDNISFLSKLVKKYESLCEQLDQKPSNEIFEWQQTTLKRILSSKLGGLESNADEMAKAMNDYPIVRTSLVLREKLEAKSEDTAFIMSFIKSARNYAATGNLDKEELNKLLKQLFPKVVQSFKIEQPFVNHHWYSASARNRIDWTLIIELIQLAHLYDADITGILDKLTSYVVSTEVKKMEGNYHEFFFPIALGICSHIEKTKRSPSDGERRFITRGLTSYVNNYVKSASEPPADWQHRTTIRCECGDCSLLRAFIRNNSESTHTFAMAERRRKHMDEQLDKSYFSTSTIKQGTPHKLVVEKTMAMTVSEFHAWIERAQAAKARLRNFAHYRCLKDQVLGEDNYRTIFEHRNLQIPVNAPGPVINAPAPVGLGPGVLTSNNNHNTIRSTIPQKRSFGFGSWS